MMSLVSTPWLSALGWALLHSLWQLSAIAALAAPVLFLLRRRTAQSRYLVASAFLAIMFLAPIGTYGYLLSTRNRPTLAPPTTPSLPQLSLSSTFAPSAFLSDFTATTPLPLSTRLHRATAPLLPPLALAYLAAVAVLSCRLLLGYRSLCRLRTAACPASVRQLALLASLQRHLHVSRNIRLLISAHIDVPTVFFAFRPLILLPATALAGLSEDHLRYLLLHELAHIRRHDYLANLVQSVIDTLLFYHPAIHWLSGIVRQEREHCCDDLTIATLGNRRTYTEALTSLEQLRTTPNLVCAATDGLLLARVRRILRAPLPRPVCRPLFTTASLAMTLSMLALAIYLAACSRTDVPPSTQPATATATSAADATPALEPNRPARVGDFVTITVYDLLGPRKDYTDTVAVSSDGTLSLLFLGKVQALGKSPRELEDAIVHALAEQSLMNHPEVRVQRAGQGIIPNETPLRENDFVITKVFELDQPNEFLVEQVAVDEKGDIPIRHLGRIHVAGLTPTDAAALVAKTAADQSILRPPVYAQVRRPLH